MSAVLPRETVPIAGAAALLQVIQTAAQNPAVDIDKTERLLAMYERIVAREAQEAFNNALADCQAEMRRVVPDAFNPQTRSRYATLAALDGALRPIYSKHRFALSYGSDTSPEPEHIRVVLTVSRGAHERQVHIDMPKDGKGAKGGDVMTKTHATGAGMSYGRRYLLGGFFNVAVGDPDTDGNTPTSTGRGSMETQTVDEWIEKVKATTTKEAAKVVMEDAAKACNALRDTDAYEAIKKEYQAHRKFIDQAAKQQ